jgi:hypothetical protein
MAAIGKGLIVFEAWISYETGRQSIYSYDAGPNIEASLQQHITQCGPGYFNNGSELRRWYCSVW